MEIPRTFAVLLVVEPEPLVPAELDGVPDDSVELMLKLETGVEEIDEEGVGGFVEPVTGLCQDSLSEGPRMLTAETHTYSKRSKARKT